jgi:glycosyltransferase involved in cell wall biosynthesis
VLIVIRPRNSGRAENGGTIVVVNSELAEAAVNDAARPSDGATIAVIIPTFNQARFLAEAIMSVLAQTRPANEIIVVDDGSTDGPANVVSQFPKVQLIRQDNRGPSAARNTGLRCCSASHIVFLDADDRLLPTALEAGLRCIAQRPDCGFVYGALRTISENGHPIESNFFIPVTGDPHLAFIRQNLIAMPAAALYRRDCLLAVKGWDETMRRCEDHDIYLRMAQRYPIVSHPDLVAEYRQHGENTSQNHVEQLKAALRLLDRHEARITVDAPVREALQRGRANKRKLYVSRMLESTRASWQIRGNVGGLIRGVIQAARWSPQITLQALIRVLVPSRTP